jgi:3,4-dihydroxy-9,10-secoandrosta-1,3,5(10)-triene-9,17-dione 4,5-dioxygenase
MTPAEMGYVVVTSTDLEAWREYATDVIGAMPVPGPDGVLHLRVDERRARIIVVAGTTDAFTATGWLMATEADFEDARKRLTDARVELRQASAEEKEIRCVTDMVGFADPAGNWHEIACGSISTPDRFVSPQGARFITGADGLGHVVLPAYDKLEEETAFWISVMGFTRANSRTFPNGRKANFLSCNGRQHGLALAELDAPAKCHHLALEVATLDDCGYALDRAMQRKMVRRNLGKHLNDNMVSFYLDTPGGFQIEYGFSDGPPSWHPGVFFEDQGGSHWGHAFME